MISKEIFPRLLSTTQVNPTPSELYSFLESLNIDPEQTVDLFGIHVDGDGFGADLQCVFVRSTRRLFLQLVPATLPKDRSVQRVCSQLANNIVDFGEELGATSVHLCIKKGDKQYAIWMRSCLYAGFALLSGIKARKTVVSTDTVVLRLKLDFIKDDMSDCTVSTCCNSDGAFSPPASPNSTDSGSPRTPSILELNA